MDIAKSLSSLPAQGRLRLALTDRLVTVYIGRLEWQMPLSVQMLEEDESNGTMNRGIISVLA